MRTRDPFGEVLEALRRRIREGQLAPGAPLIVMDLAADLDVSATPATVLTTHLTEILKENMPDLLSYAEVQKLLKELPTEQKKLVDDLVPSVVSATTIQRVLQALLRERVSIRDLPAILEGIGEAAPHTSSITLLVEQVRGRLARQLSFAYRGDDGALPIITMSGEWENAFADALIGSGEEKQLALAPSRLQDFIRAVRDSFERAALAGW